MEVSCFDGIDWTTPKHPQIHARGYFDRSIGQPTYMFFIPSNTEEKINDIKETCIRHRASVPAFQRSSKTYRFCLPNFHILKNGTENIESFDLLQK